MAWGHGETQLNGLRVGEAGAATKGLVNIKEVGRAD